MDNISVIESFWRIIHNQVFDELKLICSKDLIVSLANTGEQFNLNNYIEFNSIYPGNWEVEVIDIKEVGNNILSITEVFDDSGSHTCIAFFKVEEGLIVEQIEYWGENSTPPEWRSHLTL